MADGGAISSSGRSGDSDGRGEVRGAGRGEVQGRGRGEVRGAGRGEILAAWALVAVVACLAVVVARGFWGFSYDDSFITYRYARSVAEHGRLEYNPGERVLGTSAPGYALLLGGLAWAGGGRVGVPEWGTLLAVASLAAATLVLRLLLAAARPAVRLGAPAVFALLAFTCQWNVEMMGGEALPVLALAAGGAWLALDGRRPGQGREAWGGVLLALAAVLRLDAALAAVCVAAALAVRDRRLPVRFAVACGVPVAAFLAWLAATFGTLVPHTMAVKRSELTAGARYSASEWFWLRRCMPAPAAALLLILAVGTLVALGLRVWARRRRSAGGDPGGGGEEGGAGGAVDAAVGGAVVGAVGEERRARAGLAAGVIGAWAALHEAAYHALGVPFAPWYEIYLLNALLALAAVGVVRGAMAAAAVAPRGPARAVMAVAVAGALAAGLAPGRYVAGHFGTAPDPRWSGYVAAGEYLRTHSTGTPSAAAVEIGFFGYASRARMLDLVGLVSPRALAARAAGRLPRLVEQERPDFLVDATLFRQQYLGAILDDPPIAAGYREVATFPDGRNPGLAVRLLRRTAAPAP